MSRTERNHLRYDSDTDPGFMDLYCHIGIHVLELGRCRYCNRRDTRDTLFLPNQSGPPEPTG